MSGPVNPARFERLLRWYPSAWRVRYGGELVAFMEDTYGDDHVPARGRFGICRAGMAERFREMGLGAEGDAPAERVRGGAFLVLWAWAPVLIGGAIFAKFAEHWDVATPNRARAVPADAYNTMQVAAVLGAVIIVLAAAATLPAFARFLRAGGWKEVRRPILGAAVVTAVTTVAGAGVVVWAHRIGTVQRNGGSWPYSVAALMLGLMVVATIVTLTGAAVQATRRISLAPAVLRLEGSLALAVTIAMLVIIADTAVWWIAVATDAPWFLAGSVTGSAGTVAPPALVIAGIFMLVGFGVAAGGARRVAHGLRSLPSR